MASPDFKQFLDLCNYLPDLNGLGPAIKTEQKEHLMMCCQTPTPPSVPVCTMPSSLTLQGPPSQSRTELCSLLWRDNSSGLQQYSLESYLEIGHRPVGSGDASAAFRVRVSHQWRLLCPMNHGRVSCAGTSPARAQAPLCPLASWLAICPFL